MRITIERLGIFALNRFQQFFLSGDTGRIVSYLKWQLLAVLQTYFIIFFIYFLSVFANFMKYNFMAIVKDFEIFKTLFVIGFLYPFYHICKDHKML